MNLLHNSRRPDFRTPFGAVVVGTAVRLSLHVEDADAHALEARVRIWVDGEGERFVPMDATDGATLSATIDCAEQELVWYSFHVKDAAGRMHYVGAHQGRTGGLSVTYDYPEVPSFQITVYRHRAQRPAWYEHGIVYQIFPDRYRRDPGWRERCEAALAKDRRGPGKRIVEDWNTPPVYERDETGAIRTWDFYGGSLEGIRLDLDRLQEMGVTLSLIHI